jgi:TonB family protein
VETPSEPVSNPAHSVAVFVQVGPDGKVVQTRILRSLGDALDEKAAATVAQLPFQIAHEKGQPIGYMTILSVEFQ